jgi:hypothetical protein
MKKLLLISLLFLGAIITGTAQTSDYTLNNNVLSVDEFYNISFDGITLKSIIDTKGDPAKVESLFGMNMEKNKSNDPDYYWINFISPKISFTFDELVTSPADLDRLDVDSELVTIKIGNTVFHIGDPITMLGDVKILTRTDGSKSIVFLSEDADDQWVSIEFDQVTKLITKVEYMTI